VAVKLKLQTKKYRTQLEQLKTNSS